MKKIRKRIYHHCLRWINLKLMISLMLLAMGVNLLAQQRQTVRGTVVDSANEPLIGVAVTVKNNPGVGVVTDIDGKFSITLEGNNTVLEFSFLGMERQTIDVKGRNDIRVVMKEDTKIFDEVIIVGYGQQRKASVVGAIT